MYFGSMAMQSFTKRALVATLLALAGTLAQAQAYRCQVNGALLYQQVPCVGGIKIEVPKALEPNSMDVLVANAIAVGKVVRGMTATEVVRAWGKPSKINSSVGSYGVHEQWIYDRGEIGRSQYLYIQNNRLKSWQGPD